MTNITDDHAALRELADGLESKLWRIGQEVAGPKPEPDFELFEGIPESDEVQQLFFEAADRMSRVLTLIGRPEDTERGE